MSPSIQLLGKPRIEAAAGEDYQFRSRKSWALLAYLVLNERPPSRSQLAGLLYADADDPMRALRWGLAEIRRGLGGDASVEGDPVEFGLPPGWTVDVTVVSRGTWRDAVALPALGEPLLEGFDGRGAAAFGSWLLAERHHVAAASETILHEAALGSMSRGWPDQAIRYAARAAAMSPLDENHQALLIRLYRTTGDDTAAEQQFAACSALFREELGIEPGPAVAAALRARPVQGGVPADAASIAAIVEAGSAAVSAGAVEAGVESLRSAVRMADDSDLATLRIRSRLVIAEALIHSLRGLDEEGLAILFEADAIAFAEGDRAAVAHARAETGYVDFLRARYDRAELWLTDALDFADGSPSITATVVSYLGSVESDRGNYPRAIELLGVAARIASDEGLLRREAYARSMLGRVALLRGQLDVADEHLAAANELAHRDHWLALLPWPQALLGEVQLARGNADEAEVLLQQAFARACQLGDPCWEGMSVRGLAGIASARGDVSGAFELLADARVRTTRLADPYLWLDVYILDALCSLGVRHGHPGTPTWVDEMGRLASRTGMREFTARSLLHGAALGNPGAAEAAALIAIDLDNPSLPLSKSDQSTVGRNHRRAPGAHESSTVDDSMKVVHNPCG